MAINGYGAALTAGLLSLGIMASNPNYNQNDFRRPQDIIRKHNSQAGFDNSGKVYLTSAGAAGGAATYLVASALSALFRRRED